MLTDLYIPRKTHSFVFGAVETNKIKGENTFFGKMGNFFFFFFCGWFLPDNEDHAARVEWFFFSFVFCVGFPKTRVPACE